MPSVAAFDDPKAPAPAAAAVDVPEPMMLVVSLDAQKLDIYRGLKHVASAKISSGMPGYDTKMGVFSILEKKRRHHSNLYSGAPMPFMQRLTRSGTALHAGAIPGYPASHGCVRLPYSFAPKLFEMTSVGQNVVVTRGRPVPTRIEHPNLFELPSPKPQVAMAASVAVPRLLTDAVAGAAEGDVQTRAASFRSDAPLRMLVTRRTAHDRVMAVQYMLADLGYLARQNFIGNLGPATGNAIRAFQKANGLQATGAFTDELVSEVYRAAGKTEPPEGHLFVRQGFKRVFDLPISFRDPTVSLGTHVFTVVKRGAMRRSRSGWRSASKAARRRAALDRIDIPDAVRRSIAPTVDAGIDADRRGQKRIFGHPAGGRRFPGVDGGAGQGRGRQGGASECRTGRGRAGQGENRQEAAGESGPGGEDAELRRAPPRDQAALYQQAVALGHALSVWAIALSTDFKLTQSKERGPLDLLAEGAAPQHKAARPVKGAAHAIGPALLTKPSQDRAIWGHCSRVQGIDTEQQFRFAAAAHGARKQPTS